MSRRGRLEDAYDEEFGSRDLRPTERGLAELALCRWADDDWMIKMICEGKLLSVDQVEELRRQVLRAAEEVGLVINDQAPRPFGGRPAA